MYVCMYGFMISALVEMSSQRDVPSAITERKRENTVWTPELALTTWKEGNSNPYRD
jgi:hypothetical protein